MEFEKTDTGWIAGTAALAGAAAYFFANRMRARITPDHQLVIEKTTELARIAPRPTLATAVALLIGGAALSQMVRRRSGPRVSFIQETIEVEVPVSTAYNQWTQFEEFPRFMPTVQEVKQLDDQHLHWRANVAGKTKEWDAELTEQIPDQRIAWNSTSGPRNNGVVTFDKIGENRTRVSLMMEYEPETTAEKVGDALGGVKLTAKGNLMRFKDLIEKRGVETGAWRGSIPQQ